MPSGLFILVAIVVIVLVGVGIYRSAQRRKELAAWAHSHGLSFSSAKDHGMDERLGDFKCLRQGHSRYAYNIMEGLWAGASMTAFDYHYATGSGKNESDYHFSAVILQSSIPLKPLFIRREGLFDKITEFFGHDDIDFESAEFSRTFYVRAPDKRWAYDVIHQRMMEYLMSAGNFSVQFDCGHVIAWTSRRANPAGFEAAAELIRGMLDRLPDYLVRQQTQET